MTELENKLLAVLAEVQESLSQAKDAPGIEELRLKYLSRKGILPAMMSELGKVPPQDKPQVGKTLNQVKKGISAAFAAAQERLSAEAEEANALDVTLP